MNEDLEKKLEPFFWIEHKGSVSLCLSAGNFKKEIFDSRKDEGFEGNGYDWCSLAWVFLNEKMPELKGKIDLDPEAEMFCAYSKNAMALQKFALGFRAICDDDEMMSNLFSQVEID
ncbi:hypothetical protein JTZ08_002824 [Listeria monocytogenes]|nr:hypothetical protein [Listeria monocytogenes]EHC2218076.1 hypothetical protein [Listeria monocytogenes]